MTVNIWENYLLLGMVKSLNSLGSDPSGVMEAQVPFLDQYSALLGRSKTSNGLGGAWQPR